MFESTNHTLVYIYIYNVLCMMMQKIKRGKWIGGWGRGPRKGSQKKDITEQVVDPSSCPIEIYTREAIIRSATTPDEINGWIVYIVMGIVLCVIYMYICICRGSKKTNYAAQFNISVCKRVKENNPPDIKIKLLSERERDYEEPLTRCRLFARKEIEYSRYATEQFWPPSLFFFWVLIWVPLGMNYYLIHVKAASFAFNSHPLLYAP